MKRDFMARECTTRLRTSGYGLRGATDVAQAMAGLKPRPTARSLAPGPCTSHTPIRLIHTSSEIIAFAFILAGAYRGVVRGRGAARHPEEGRHACLGMVAACGGAALGGARRVAVDAASPVAPPCAVALDVRLEALSRGAVEWRLFTREVEQALDALRDHDLLEDSVRGSRCGCGCSSRRVPPPDERAAGAGARGSADPHRGRYLVTHATLAAGRSSDWPSIAECCRRSWGARSRTSSGTSVVATERIMPGSGHWLPGETLQRIPVVRDEQRGQDAVLRRQPATLQADGAPAHALRRLRTAGLQPCGVGGTSPARRIAGSRPSAPADGRHARSLTARRSPAPDAVGAEPPAARHQDRLGTALFLRRNRKMITTPADSACSSRHARSGGDRAHRIRVRALAHDARACFVSRPSATRATTGCPVIRSSAGRARRWR